jgi:hypothetical protein
MNILIVILPQELNTPNAFSSSGRVPGSGPGGPGFNSRPVPRVISLDGRQEGHPVRKIISQLHEIFCNRGDVSSVHMHGHYHKGR